MQCPHSNRLFFFATRIFSFSLQTTVTEVIVEVHQAVLHNIPGSINIERSLILNNLI